jgi:acyl carrier protein
VSRRSSAAAKPRVLRIDGDQFAKCVGGRAHLAGVEGGKGLAFEQVDARIDLRRSRPAEDRDAAHEQDRDRQPSRGTVHRLIIALMCPSDSAAIAAGVVDVLKNVSRRPIEPSLDNELVADLGFDSLQVLEVVSELEDRFGITIPEADVPAVRTVAQVVERVARLIAEQSTS